MIRLPLRASAPFVLACVLSFASVPSVLAQAPQASKPTGPLNELDAFMEKVLKRREANKQTLQQYVLDEVETFEVLGPTRMPVYRQKRDFTWYVRDGLHVRSPEKFDGVTVGDKERRRYEDSWVKRERTRLENNAKREKERLEAAAKKGTTVEAVAEPQRRDRMNPAGPAGGSPIPTPRFVSEAYFMDFKFEAGNYYLAGREQLEGHDGAARSSTTRPGCSTTTRTRRRPEERRARRNRQRRARPEQAHRSAR